MSRVAQWVRDRRRVRLGRFAAWLTVAVTLIVTSTTVWAQQSTSPGDASQVESVPADQAQLDPADVTGGITIREGLEATRPAVDDGTAETRRQIF